MGDFATNMRRQLTGEEDRVPHAYPDKFGFLTIGIGHLIDKRKGGRLRDSEIDFIFENDLKEKEGEVMRAIPWYSRLDDARKAVLLGMAFQMGLSGLMGFRNTLAMVERGDYAGAAGGMLNSLWAKQTPERAQRMAKQMRTGEWQFKEGF